jgi:hypothetical protein
MRSKHKSWQNQRPGWTRRVTWYAGDADVRLRFEDGDGKTCRYYRTAEEAQKDYDAFRAGMLNVLSLMERK